MPIPNDKKLTINILKNHKSRIHSHHGKYFQNRIRCPVSALIPRPEFNAFYLYIYLPGLSDGKTNRQKKNRPGPIAKFTQHFATSTTFEATRGIGTKRVNRIERDANK